MNKKVKTLFIIAIITISAKSINAQPCDIRPDDLSEFKNRTLIVDFQREKINTWFMDFWKFNKNIEFKTQEECLKITKEQQSKYLVLGTFYEEMNYNNSLGKKESSSHSLRMIGLVRLEDYKKSLKGNINSVAIACYTPEFDEGKTMKEKLLGKRTEEYILRDAEVKLTLKILVNQLNEIENNSLKKYNTRDLSKDQAKINCPKISSKDIYIDKTFLKDASDINELKRNKKFKVNIVTSEQIDEKIENNEDVLIAYSSPYGIQGANDVLIFTHFLVNAKDGVFYYESGRSMFGMPGAYFRKAVFKEILDCSK